MSPVISTFIFARLFSVPQVENDIKRTPLCEFCWVPRSRNWWIKEGPKRGIFGSFSEILRPRKSLYISQWSLFWIKKRCVSSSVFDLKNQSQNLDRTAYIYSLAPYKLFFGHFNTLWNILHFKKVVLSGFIKYYSVCFKYIFKILLLSEKYFQ